MYIYIYIRYAKFGVYSIQGIYISIEGGVNLPWVYMHCSIYI